MDNPDTLWEYANNFKRLFSKHLKPGVGISADVHRSKGPGAVLEFFLYKKQPTQAVAEVTRGTKETVNEVLKTIEQHGFGGNLDAFQFSGTNMLLEPNRIILIKGGDSLNEWDEKAVNNDIEEVLKAAQQNRQAQA